MTAPAEPRTYAAYFQNTAVDPIGTNNSARPILTSIYRSWRSNDTPPDSNAVLSSTLNHFEERAIGAVGFFLRSANGDNELHIAHGIRKYPGTLGVTSVLANAVFGYLDDVDDGNAEIMQFNDSLFGLTGAINVATVDQHKDALEADPTITILPARAAGADHSESIKARMSAFIPFSLVPLLIEQRLSARDAFLIVEAHLDIQGVRDVCGPLMDFLRVAGTKTTGDVILNTLVEPGPTFRAEKGLTKYMRTKVLYRDLPVYSDPIGRSDPATAALTSAVTTLTASQVRADEANQRRRDEDDRPKSIPEAFGDLSTQKLMRLCRKEMDSELPVIYGRLANKKKREDLLTIVQQTIEEMAEPMGAPVVTVTPAVLAYIKSFRFSGNDDTDVGTGVLPMSFVPPGGVSGKARARRVEDTTASFAYMNMMSTEGQHITSEDAQALSRSKGYIPCQWTEATVQLRAYAPVLATLVGNKHPIFEAYQKGVRLYTQNSLELQSALDARVGERLAPGLLVYTFQVRLKGWFEHQWRSVDNFDVPNFGNGFWRYLMDKNLEWLPDISSIPELRLLSAPAPEGAPPRDRRTPFSTGQSPAGTSGGEERRPAQAQQTRETNTQLDSRFTENNELGERIKRWKVSKAVDAMKALGKGIPEDGTGKERCITFHAKGYCFSGCRHKQDHTPLPAGNGADKFYEWCREAYS